MLGRIGRIGGNGKARLVLGLLAVFLVVRDLDALPSHAQATSQGNVQNAAQTQSSPSAASPSPASQLPPTHIPAAPAQLPAPAKGATTGQAVPRFASFKSDKVHVRNGPGTDHAILWVYNRAGLPVEIIAESDAWRRVRDSEGATGWVLATLLSGRRTALVEPWSLKPNTAAPVVPLRSEPRDNGPAIAQIEAGVIASVRNCDGRWCAVGILDFRGFIEQQRLWGVYKGESVKP